MASVLSKQMRVDSGNEDVKSSSCDEEYPIHICSPQRRDGKASWRSPTVRPKRRQQCKSLYYLGIVRLHNGGASAFRSVGLDSRLKPWSGQTEVLYVKLVSVTSLPGSLQFGQAV